MRWVCEDTANGGKDCSETNNRVESGNHLRKLSRCDTATNDGTDRASNSSDTSELGKKGRGKANCQK